jgi:hypothetical protein
MDFKKYGKDLDRINYFNNIALRSIKQCIKSFDSEDIEDTEEECLKKQAFNLHYVVSKGELEEYAIMGNPYKPY